MNINNFRELVGFLVTPIIPPLLLYIYFNFIINTEGSPRADTFILIPFGYFGALCIGGPLHIYLKRRKKQGLGLYIIYGAAIGFSLGVFTVNFRAGFLGLMCGGISAAIFWWIAVKSVARRYRLKTD